MRHVVRLDAADSGTSNILTFKYLAIGRIEESLMITMRASDTGENRLRFVFDDTVISFAIAPDATFADVARKWGEVEPRDRGSPIAIDVTLIDALPNRLSPDCF